MTAAQHQPDAAPQLATPIDDRRPALAFRVGVTGASDLPDATDPLFKQLSGQVEDVLARVHAQIATLFDQPEVRAAYDIKVPPSLRCVSPLGAGADQMFAGAVMGLAETPGGVTRCLEVIIPFDRTTYRDTLASDDPIRHRAAVAAFDTLIADARCGVLELDGDGVDDIVRPLSYEAVGRAVVRNADLIVAVWDKDRPAKGRGGTRDTVHYALQAGVPVWLIDAAGKAPPRFLTEPLDFWKRPADPPEIVTPAEAVACARRACEEHVARIIAPPAVGDGEPDRLGQYYAEPLRSCMNIWLLHPKAMRWAKGAPRRADAMRYPWLKPHAVVQRKPFKTTSSIAGALSEAYQNRYRTSYLMVFLAAALALIAGAIGVARQDLEILTTFAELSLLGGAGRLIWRNQHDRWHERYIDYRMIGELARSTSYLHALGWGMPFRRLRRAAGGQRESWVAWLVAAHARAVPLPMGRLQTNLTAVREGIVIELLEDQIDFHERRHGQSHRAGKRFEWAGRFLFGLTIAVGLIKFAMLIVQGLAELHLIRPEAAHWFGHGGIEMFGTVAIVLAALSAAAFGIRAYEEFEQLSALSAQMAADLKHARQQVEHIDLSLPLASQMLASETFDAASIMLNEVTGWAQLFRMKHVDA